MCPDVSTDSERTRVSGDIGDSAVESVWDDLVPLLQSEDDTFEASLDSEQPTSRRERRLYVAWGGGIAGR